ncbi:MAG: aspartate--tRNA ligase [Candidatus Krumholzibacteriota bacterium]|nr:aspartate--tRNA ligase [Candidatus Krumholzibacteriota bacterium]
MSEPSIDHVSKEWRRTNRCGEIRSDDVDKEVTLAGWVKKVREFGDLTFVDLWDRTGLIQLVTDSRDPELNRISKSLRAEDVIGCKGRVRDRPSDMINEDMKTGEVEVYISDIVIFNRSETPPFNVSDKGKANIELRLKYRYLDLRRDSMQKNLRLRHDLAMSVRQFLSEEGLLEIETPMLVKRTPEGARDYLVPSRLHEGKFYALPQSPQLYKQILMVSGVDGYFQLARCLRDEDLRADRQPEHTQIDIEMSFISEDEIIDLSERLMKRIFSEVCGVKLDTPFPKIDYKTAMADFGTDKPDTRAGFRIHDCTEIFESTEFKVFSSVIKEAGVIRGISYEAGYGLSKSQIKKLEKHARENGAKGLVWIRINGGVESPVEDFLSDGEISELKKEFGLNSGRESLLLLVAGSSEISSAALGALRKRICQSNPVGKKDKFNFTWVNNFPIFFESTEGDIEPAHHIFSMPREEDMEFLDKNPLKVRGHLYDLVCNGIELGSGSIRVHKRKLQEKLLSIVGVDKKSAAEKFGFLLESFEFGAPPHGGIALGLDRLAMIMGEGNSIRDYIAFPKTQNAVSLMDGAPSSVEKEVLRELHVRFLKRGTGE